MRDYGIIQSAYWTHPDVKGLTDGAKLLGAYLLTCPHANGLGCFHAPLGYIATDLGWLVETVSERFAELFANGFCKRCGRTEYVLIENFLRWNPIANANCAKARVAEYRSIPSHFLYFSELGEAMMQYGAFWPKGFETVRRTVRQTVAEPEQNRTEQEQNKKGAREESAEKRARFVPPTVEQVQAHIREKGYAFSAEAFVAFYASKGWKVGNAPMKCWQSACVTWQGRTGESAKAQEQTPRPKRKTFDEILGGQA
jgi:hypothetical protein